MASGESSSSIRSSSFIPEFLQGRGAWCSLRSTSHLGGFSSPKNMSSCYGFDMQDSLRAPFGYELYSGTNYFADKAGPSFIELPYMIRIKGNKTKKNLV